MAAMGIDMLGYSPYLSWPFIATGLVIVFALSQGLYNLFLHPLRAVPGPKLWATSRLPYTLAWLSGNLPRVMLALHERHGDIVRVDPNRLSFTHPDAWRDIRGHRKVLSREHPKDPLLYQGSRHNILGAIRADHARFRRILSHGFSAKSMQGQQPLITQYVDVLMDRLHDFTHDKNGNPFPAVVNLTAWFNFATFDIIGDLAFGEPFNCLAESRYHPWVDAILRTVEQFGWWLAMQWHVPQLLKVIRTLSPGRYIGAGSDTQVDFATQKVTKRLELGASRPDFLEAMMTAEGEDGAMLTRDEMVANSRILVLAGSETTSSALAGTAYFLAKYPKVQRRLAEEVRSGYGSEEEIDLFSVNKLKYMLAVLDESMRMFPPVPSQLPRVCHQGGDVICGVNVPENTGLDIWPWAMNYCSRNFTEPDKFIPERWLDEIDGPCQDFEKGRQSALQPFSVGPRNCIGKNLAYVEMRLILARLVWNYDLVLADEVSERFPECKSFNLWLKGPLNVRLTPVARG